MKKLFVIGTVVVLVCSMWVSVNHTLALFRAGKFTNGLEVPATIAAETAFIMGLLSIFDARRKGTSPPWQAKMLFMLGLIVVGWSNVGAGIGYAWSGVWTAVILGVLIPIFIFGAEAVLTHAYFESAKRKRRADDPAHAGEPSRAAQLGEIRVGASQWESTAQSSHWEDAQLGENELGAAQMTTPAHWAELTAHLGTAQAEKLSQREETAHSQVGAPKNEPGDSQAEAVAQETTVSQETPPTQEEAAQLGVGDSHAEESSQLGEVTLGDSQKWESEPSQSDASQEEPPTQKQTNPSQNKLGAAQSDEIAQAIEAALSYQKEHNKLPSRRKLAEIASCSEWVARKALQQLQKAS